MNNFHLIKSKINIRKETASDTVAIYSINATAFETDVEARLVDLLREQAQPHLSLVAEIDNEVVGHIKFSPAAIDDYPDLKLMGMGPMAVQPKNQNKGVGSALVQAGLDACRKMGMDGVVVLGHPEYYPRFGFLPAHSVGITCSYYVPPDVFMAVEIRVGAFAGKSGTVKYHTAFDNL
jgi:putative acetyltransferase